MIRRNSVIYRALFLAPLICHTIALSSQDAVQNQASAVPQLPLLQTPDVLFHQTTPLPTTASSVPTNKKAIEGQLQNPTQDDKTTTETPSIYLNFDNASLASIINYMGEQKQINLLPHKDLEGVKVSLSTRKPLTLEKAWNLVLTLLEMNGFSMIKVTTKKGGDLYRIVLNKENGQTPLQTYSSATGTEPESLPDTDVVIRYVYFFKNIKAEMAQNIMSKMLDDGAIIVNNTLNLVIIKEKSLNIKAAMKITKELDNGGIREAIEMIPLTWVNAETVDKLFKDILATTDSDPKVIKFSAIGQAENNYFSSSTKIYTEPVKNMVILLGNKKNIDRVREFIFKYIDVPIDAAESRLHIKEIRYAKAEDIAPLLQDIIRLRTTSDKAAVAEGGYKVFEDVIVSAERADVDQQTGRGGGNRLIVACNKEDWKRIESFIEEIDKPQLQVAIEVMLVNVESSQDKELGAQEWGWLGKMPKGLASVNGLEFLNLAGVARTTTDGVTPNNSYLKFAENLYQGEFCASIGDKQNKNIWAMIMGYFNTQNSHVIAQPSVVANNNMPCLINMSTSYLVDGPLTTAKGELSQVQKVNFTATNSIVITPRINYSGLVDLKIEVSYEDLADDIMSKVSRKMSTKASMSTGEVLVLGGLTYSKLTESIYRTPILGYIPILGNLFTSKVKVKEESNLYIFIRPSIIRPRFEGSPDEYTQLKLDYAKYQIMKNDNYITERDPIQRWFFKPAHTSIKQRMADYANGILRPIDDYAYGMNQPKTVNIQEDPYFKSSEDLVRLKQRREERKHRQMVHEAN